MQKGTVHFPMKVMESITAHSHSTNSASVVFIPSAYAVSLWFRTLVQVYTSVQVYTLPLCT